MNKNFLLGVSLVGTLILFANLLFLQGGYCTSSEWCSGSVREFISAAPGYLSLFFATLLITTVAYLQRTEMFRGFLFFTIIWVSMSVVAGMLFGQSSGGWVTSSPNPAGVFFLFILAYGLIGLTWQISVSFLRE